MAKDGHAPSYGPGNTLWALGQGECPDCRVSLQDDTCPQCGAEYRGVP